MGMNSNLYKSFNIHENTPKNLYNELDKEFHFNFDPCPSNALYDGLKIKWGEFCFVNPPYGKTIKLFLEKALEEIKIGNCKKAVFLLPSYTDVKWFHEIILPYSKEIRFLKGRIKFGEHKNTAPFGSMICIFE
jgi:hypothetical protein